MKTATQVELYASYSMILSKNAYALELQWSIKPTVFALTVQLLYKLIAVENRLGRTTRFN